MAYGVGKYGTGVYGRSSFAIGHLNPSLWLPQTAIEGTYVSHATGALDARPTLATLRFAGVYIQRDGLVINSWVPVLQFSGSYHPPPISGELGIFLPKARMRLLGRRIDPFGHRLKINGVLELLSEAREALEEDRRLGTVQVRKILGPEDVVEPFFLLLDEYGLDRSLWTGTTEDQGIISGPPEEFLVEVKQILLGS
jgi:hypothetical protein